MTVDAWTHVPLVNTMRWTPPPPPPRRARVHGILCALCLKGVPQALQQAAAQMPMSAPRAPAGGRTGPFGSALSQPPAPLLPPPGHPPTHTALNAGGACMRCTLRQGRSRANKWPFQRGGGLGECPKRWAQTHLHVVRQERALTGNGTRVGG